MGVQINGTDAISTVLKGDKITMADMWNGGGPPVVVDINFEQFKLLNKRLGTVRRLIVDLTTLRWIKAKADGSGYDSSTISGSQVMTHFPLTSINAGDKFYFRSIANFTTFDSSRWYQLPFEGGSKLFNGTLTFKASIIRDLNTPDTTNAERIKKWTTLDGTKDLVQVRALTNPSESSADYRFKLYFKFNPDTNNNTINAGDTILIEVDDNGGYDAYT